LVINFFLYLAHNLVSEQVRREWPETLHSEQAVGDRLPRVLDGGGVKKEDPGEDTISTSELFMMLF
jgi:hypothetical protein